MRFTVIGEARTSGFWDQFTLLFKRSLLYQIRNPKSLMALLAMAILNSIIFASMFHSVGSNRFMIPIDEESR